MGIFTGEGRIGRLHYFLTNLAIGLGLVVCWFASVDVNDFTGEATVHPLYWPMTLVGLWLSAGNMIRRLHDRSHNGYLWLLSFVPIVGLLLGLYLLFAPGDPVLNKYGPTPGTGSRADELEAQRRRADQIAAVAEQAYRVNEGDYVNEDGSFNMDGLMASMAGSKPGPPPPPPADPEPFEGR